MASIPVKPEEFSTQILRENEELEIPEEKQMVVFQRLKLEESSRIVLEGKIILAGR